MINDLVVRKKSTYLGNPCKRIIRHSSTQRREIILLPNKIITLFFKVTGEMNGRRIGLVYRNRTPRYPKK